MKQVKCRESSRNGLYPIPASHSAMLPATPIAFSTTNTTISIWHNRLGHPGLNLYIMFFNP